jgi:hypothetical protein
MIARKSGTQSLLPTIAQDIAVTLFPSRVRSNTGGGRCIVAPSRFGSKDIVVNFRSLLDINVEINAFRSGDGNTKRVIDLKLFWEVSWV